jgi:stress-induced morphogen
VADVDEIKRMIERALPGAEVDVVDETGTADHLRATVRAEQFRGLSRLDQHRLVRRAVQKRMDDGSIHALSVKTIVAGREARGADSVTSSENHDG